MPPAASLPSLAQAEALDPRIAEGLRASGRRVVIVGAGGWIGKALLAGLWHALGAEDLARRVVCFGSSARTVEFGDGRSVDQRPLAELGELPCMPSVVFHLAFLTKDKVAGMAEADYVAANRQISQTVLSALDRIGADRLFLASSGAARFADDEAAAHDLRLYGRLKRDDERTFADWAQAAPGRCAIVMRIFSLAGPFINKHETYALASFVLDALAGRPIRVNAPMAVVRSYVAIRELLSLAVACLEDAREEARSVVCLDSGGVPIELRDLAKLVTGLLGGEGVVSTLPSDTSSNIYTSDPRQYLALIARYDIAPVNIDAAILECATYLAQNASCNLPAKLPID